MAVADGHGGSRYWLSDVGSRLACDLAIAMATEDLSQRHLNNSASEPLGEMRNWLANTLPARLVEAWNRAIEADWQQRDLPEAHQGEPFSSQTYGSTLALVVLTPLWWGHTGLGDWDLVLLSNHQPDQILSQESDQGLQGEATQSLCLPRASRCFAARTAVHRLSGTHREACGLVLSTDGIRKSCATDADHLALCRYLLEEAHPRKAQAAGPTERLDSSLDRISREGSGDDVSAALACFGTLKPLEQQEPLERAALAAAPPELPGLPDLAPPVLPEEQLPKPTATRSRRGRRRSATTPEAKRLRLVASLITIAAVMAIAAWLWLTAPTARQPTIPIRAGDNRAPTDDQAEKINLEIKALCSKDPDLVASILAKRKDILRNINTEQQMLNRLLDNRDWRGSLILLYRPGSNQASQLASPCPSLSKALRSYWMQQQQTLDARTNTPIQQLKPSSQ